MAHSAAGSVARHLIRTVTARAGDGVRAAFYIVDADGTCLRPVSAAGGMPAAYICQVDGFKIGTDSLACGLAVASGMPVITRDVFEEPLWAPWRPLAREFDFRGCWSFPIATRAGQPVGTFAMYHREPRDTTPHDLSLANAMTQAAAIIIARHTEAEERKRAEHAVAADLRATRLLHELAMRLSVEGDLQALSEQVLETAMALLHADAGTVQLLEDATQRLVLSATKGVAPEMAAHGHRLDARANTFWGIALAQGERLFLDFAAPESEDRNGAYRIHREAGLVSGQMTPLLAPLRQADRHDCDALARAPAVHGARTPFPGPARPPRRRSGRAVADAARPAGVGSPPAPRPQHRHVGVLFFTLAGASPRAGGPRRGSAMHASLAHESRLAPLCPHRGTRHCPR